MCAIPLLTHVYTQVHPVSNNRGVFGKTSFFTAKDEPLTLLKWQRDGTADLAMDVITNFIDNDIDKNPRRVARNVNVHLKLSKVSTRQRGSQRLLSSEILGLPSEWCAGSGMGRRIVIRRP